MPGANQFGGGKGALINASGFPYVPIDQAKGIAGSWFGSPPVPPVPESIVRAYNVTTTYPSESYSARETTQILSSMTTAKTVGVGLNTDGTPYSGHIVNSEGIPTAIEGDGGAFRIPNEKVYFERGSYENVLDIQFTEFAPSLPAVDEPELPPFLPPTLRLRSEVGGDPKPSGIIVYNARFWILGDDKGYWESLVPTSTGKVVCEAGAYIVLSADAWSYKTDTGEEIREGLTYEWIIDGTVVSVERGLRMFDVFPNGLAKPNTGIFRLSNDEWTPKSYDITLKVTNKIGTSISQIGLLVYGGQDGLGANLDASDFEPFQDRAGYYMNFYDSTRNFAPYTGTPVGDEGLFEVVVTDEQLYYTNQSDRQLDYPGPPQFNLSTSGPTDLGDFVVDGDGTFWYWSGIPSITTVIPNPSGGPPSLFVKGAGKGTGAGGGPSFWWNEGVQGGVSATNSNW